MLSREQTDRALAAISAWRAGPETAVFCPVCGKEGLVVTDRSTRPYAEWYYLTCATCGLEETLHIPMSPPSSDALD